jgi:cytochrome c-type biogenesis protein CcmE
VVALAMVGVCAAFIKNASPYVTVAQAKESHADGVHLAGDLVKNSIQTDARSGEIKFTLKDQDGAEAHVVYVGSIPGNLSEATKVVAIGGMQTNDVFMAHELLVKCPSKYESVPSLESANKRV